MKDYLKEIFAGIVILAVLIAVVITSNVKSNLEDATSYDCNYHSINIFRTVIDIKSQDKDYATIEGEHVKVFVLDPLVMKKDDEVVGKAGDKYDFITQDSHAISLNDNLYLQMSGDIKVFGEQYNIYDSNGKYIGKADFNAFGTNGTFEDKNGNVIAEYNSGLFRKDYTVTIKNDTNINEDAILLMFASYASDFAFDND